VGRGDNLIATGFARGAAARGKRIAFGTGGRTAWGMHSAEIFRGNPNIARPGTERRPDVEWIDYRKGHRLYNSWSGGRSWTWHPFTPIPGEVFFDDDERAWSAGVGSGFVVIEPNVETWKPSAANKQWPTNRYDAVAEELARQGREVVQFVYGGHNLPTARLIKAPSFRHALAAMAKASLYIGSEGGMHHGAAAVGVKGVVIFGGWIPPTSTGYAMHSNLASAGEACGRLSPCSHCRDAMNSITIDQVLSAAQEKLDS
jgi:hypothetical protein